MRWGIFFVALVSVLVYAPTLWGGLPLDDEFVANAVRADGSPWPLVGEMASPLEYFRTHWWSGHFEASELFRPWTKLSYAVVYALGLGVGGQHALNVLAHAGCAICVVLLVRRFCGANALLPSLAAGLVFAVHAIHSEAVATLSGRAELFAFGFGALGLLLVDRGLGTRVVGAGVNETQAAASGRASWPSLLLGGSCFFVAFGSKESAVGWLGFGPLFVWLRTRAEEQRAAVAESSTVPSISELPAPVAGVSTTVPTDAGVTPLRRSAIAFALVAIAFVAWFGLRQAMVSSLTAEVGEIPATVASANPLVAVSHGERIWTATKILGFGLGRCLLPLRLAADHGPSVFSISTSPFDFAVLGSLLVFVAWWILAWRTRRRQPLLLLGALAFFGFALVTSNLVFAIGTIFGERLYYSSSFAVSLLAAAFVESTVTTAFARKAVLAALGVWSIYCAGYSAMRAVAFETTSTIAVHDVAHRDDSARLHQLAADAAIDRSDLGTARTHLLRATQLDPPFAGAWLALGAVLQRMQRPDEALACYEQGIRVSDAQARVDRARLHANLARMLWTRNRRSEAIAKLRAAVGLDPRVVAARAFLLHWMRIEKAPAAELERVLADGERLTPGAPEWDYERGAQAFDQRDFARAETLLRRCVAQRRGHAHAWILLARTLLALGGDARKRDARKREALRLLNGFAQSPKQPPDVRAAARRALEGAK